MSDSNQPSTLKSYADSAVGAVQSTIGSLTGSNQDQIKGEARENKAQAEHEASHATAKLPGATVSGSGAVTRDNSDRNDGKWNQTMGAAKETLGGLIGNESLKTAGRQQNLEGQQQEAKGQLKDFGSGVSDRAYGTVGSAISGLTGDKEGKAHFEQLRAEGKTTQRGVEHDILKKAEAEDKYRENV